MTTYYLGSMPDGRIVSRASTNEGFTHAAWTQRSVDRLPAFSTSKEGAIRNFHATYGKNAAYDVVRLRKVTAAEYRAAKRSASGRARSAAAS